MDGIAGCVEVIKPERIIANGSVIAGENTEPKRVIAKSGVAGSVDVAEKRVIAKSVVELGNAVSQDVIIIEHKGADTIVEADVEAVDERVTSNGYVATAAEVQDHRCSANCGILARAETAIEGQRSSANRGVEAGVTG